MKLTKFIFSAAAVIILSFSMNISAFAEVILHYDGMEHLYTQAPISIEIDGEVLETEVPPVAINSRTLVPARAIFEKLGATVKWIAPDNVYIMLDNDFVALKLNSANAVVNGESKVMEVPPKIINDSTMVPVRFVSEYFGFGVEWDNDNRIVKIDSTRKNTNDKTDKDNNEKVPVEIEKPNLELPKEVIFEGDGSLVPNKVIQSNITEEKNSKVNIISFEQISSEIFKITASGKISTVKYGTLPNPDRLYIDITNSASKLANSIEIKDSENISSVRASQNTADTTRIVFDLKQEKEFEVILSEDRKSVTVEFGTLIVNKVKFNTYEKSDEILISATSGFEPKISRLSNPDRLIIDIENSFSAIGVKAADILGKYAYSIRTAQFDEDTSRIVLDVDGNFDYSVEKNEKDIKIILSEAGYNNVRYENHDHARLILKKNSNIDSKAIVMNSYDDYRNKKYTIVFNGDYSGIYGSGEYKIGDTYLESVIIQTFEGNTELIFREKSIYAYVIEEDEDNIYIYVRDPRDVYDKVVLIDAGHGDHDPGAIQNGVVEKNVNLAVSNKLFALLEADKDIKVYSTRSDDTFLTLQERAKMADEVADLFISIHSNSMDNKNISGVQIFYPNPADERGSISKNIASILMNTVTSATGLSNRPAQQSMGYEFVVLKKSNVPACLVEMGFLTNWSDAQKLSSEEGQNQIAQGLYNGIKRTFEEILK